jgi:hypothetical protein
MEVAIAQIAAEHVEGFHRTVDGAMSFRRAVQFTLTLGYWEWASFRVSLSRPRSSTH